MTRVFVKYYCLVVLLVCFACQTAIAQNSTFQEIGNLNLPEHSRFGNALSVNGNYLAIGAPGETIDGEANRGAVYIYELVNNWVQLTKLIATDGQVHDYFGSQLAFSGTHLVITSLGDFGGSVYFFEKQGNNWIEKQKIKHDDVNFTSRFGSTLVLNQHELFIGAFSHIVNNPDEGLVFHYEFDGDSWEFNQTIDPPVSIPGLKFGAALAVNSEFLAVGASGTDSHVKKSGSVFLYQKVNDTFTFHSEIKAPNPGSYHLFGESIGMDEHSILIGSRMYHPGDNIATGAAFVYNIIDETVVYSQELNHDNGEKNDFFGHSVAIEGNYALISSIRDNIDGKVDAGSVTLFEKVANTWVSKQILTAGAKKENYSSFGNALALNDGRVVIGAKLRNNQSTNSGEVFASDVTQLINVSLDNLRPDLPNNFELAQNYPNPFNPTTNIQFSLPVTENVTIRVYNIAGQQVATLLNARKPAGYHLVRFDASRLSSGIYFYRMVVGDYAETKKLVLIK